MTVVPQAAVNGPSLYGRRRPSRTLLYRTVQVHFETWLALTHDEAIDDDPVPCHVEREFRRYLSVASSPTFRPRPVRAMRP